MKEIISFPKLQAEDIEVKKGGKVNDDLNFYLLYQNSRTTMKLLDETFGSLGWQITYTSVGNTIYGNLSVWDENKMQWITKADTGEFSSVAENKGLSSDILKRCSVRLGIGRELYTAPRIVLPNTIRGEVKVKSIQYDDDKIISLELENNGKTIYHWDINTGATLYVNNGGSTNISTTTNNVNTEQKKISVEDVRSIGADYMKKISENDKNEFTNFMKYYIKRVENNNFKGEFKIEILWDKWKNSSYRKAS